MNIKVYKIEFNKSNFELENDWDNLSDYELEIVNQLDCLSLFDYEDHNSIYISFIISKPDELDKYSDILTRNSIWHKVTDISKDILKSKVDLESELTPHLSSFNSLKLEFFMEDLNNWILSNLDIDTVLDRISEVGIENLKPIEKEFLKNFKLS
jgi:hypothetical protein